MVSSLEGRRTVTGGAEDSYWRGAGQRTVTGGAEDSHWRGGGQLLEGRRTVTGMTDATIGLEFQPGFTFLIQMCQTGSELKLTCKRG